MENLEELQDFIINNLSISDHVFTNKNVVLDEPDPSTYTENIMIHIVFDSEEVVERFLGGGGIYKTSADVYTMVSMKTRSETYSKIKELSTAFKILIEEHPEENIEWDSVDYFPEVEGSRNMRALKIRLHIEK